MPKKTKGGKKKKSSGGGGADGAAPAAAAAAAAESPFVTHTLSTSGAALPAVGLGTWRAEKGEVASAVRVAIGAGYRHLDLASNYLNEAEIGDELKRQFDAGTVRRDELFVTLKLNNPYHHEEHVEPHVRKSLLDLMLDDADLLLLHWPVAFRYVPYDGSKRGFDDAYDPDGCSQLDLSAYGGSKLDDSVTVKETWQAMERLVDAKLVKAIGVCNMTREHLADVLSYARIKPAVLQVEAHPYLQQTELLDYCTANGIVFEAYSPLGTPGFAFGQRNKPRLLDDRVLARIARRHGDDVSVADVCLRWGVQRGTVVLPKSVTPARIERNMRHALADAAARPLTLSDDDMALIAALDRGLHYLDPFEWYGRKLFGDNHAKRPPAERDGCRVALLLPAALADAADGAVVDAWHAAAAQLAERYGVEYVRADQLGGGGDDGKKASKKSKKKAAAADGAGAGAGAGTADALAAVLGGPRCVHGFVLSGWPCTLDDAKALDALLCEQLNFAAPPLDGVFEVVLAGAGAAPSLQAVAEHYRQARVYAPLAASATDDAAAAFSQLADTFEASRLDREIEQFQHLDMPAPAVAAERDQRARSAQIGMREAALAEREAAVAKAEALLAAKEAQLNADELKLSADEHAFAAGDWGVGNGVTATATAVATADATTAVTTTTTTTTTTAAAAAAAAPASGGDKKKKKKSSNGDAAAPADKAAKADSKAEKADKKEKKEKKEKKKSKKG